MEIEFASETGDYGPETASFVHATGARLKVLALDAPIKAAGPASVIAISIDPETIKLIFQYLAATLAATGGGAFFLSLLKKMADGAAEKAGEKIAEVSIGAIEKLWSDTWTRIDEIDRSERYTRVYFSLSAQLAASRFQADAFMTPLELRSVTGAQLAWLKKDAASSVVKHLLPIAAGFVHALGPSAPDVIKARLHSRVEARGFAHWTLAIPGLGEFAVDQEGIILSGDRRHPERWAPEEIPDLISRATESWFGRWKRRLWHLISTSSVGRSS